ncbi:hypothetical protein APHAL10511_006889 [Amanita phalloides]|nr:hypothetical protein APHAL10511_006889 [Amanita phalloides]
MAFDLSGSLSKNQNYPGKIGRHSDFYTGTCIKQGYGLPEVIGIKALRANVVYKVFTDEFTEKFKKHIDRWVTFDHANFARCYGYALDCGPMPAIIMDYYPEGEIMRYMKAKRSSFEEKINMALADVVEGLCYLHALKPPVVHGDLRAASIFVTKTGRVVLADYELGYMIPSRDYTGYVFEEHIGWLAPELLLEDNPTCTAATDAFALAMTIVEMTSNDVPFGSKRNALVLRLRDIYRRPNLPAEVLGCTWLSVLVQRCWNEEPLARPKASSIVDIFATNSVTSKLGEE